MEDDKTPPSLYKGKVTQLYIELQICEKFGINPLEYFCGTPKHKIKMEYDDEGKVKEMNIIPSVDWEDSMHIKALLIAYHQLNAEEEKRISDKMNKEVKKGEDN